MREYYQVIGYSITDDTEDVIDTFEVYDDALKCLFKCQEGNDKHDPWEYYIDSTSVAE